MWQIRPAALGFVALCSSSSSKKHVIALSEAITDCDDRQEMVWVSVSEK